MQPSPSFSNPSLPVAASTNPQCNQPDERAYRGVTVVAVLLLLISICAFW